jgi:hypothetical protein
MTALLWDQVGERLYETGVDRGVLYLPDETGVYDTAVAWNGLTTVTESPSGAEVQRAVRGQHQVPEPHVRRGLRRDDRGFHVPGRVRPVRRYRTPTPGWPLGQQGRRVFGLAYRTRVGNDLEGTDHGYKLHLIYGAQASPSEKAYATINDSPEAITFSWELTTTPVPVTTEVDGVQLKPTAQMVIDSTKVDAGALSDLEDILFGTVVDDARLPMPDEVVAIFTGGEVDVDLSAGENQPTFVDATGVLTLPAVTGVQWKVGGVNKAPGAQPAIAAGAQTTVRATAVAGYNLQGDDKWTFHRDA